MLQEPSNCNTPEYDKVIKLSIIILKIFKINRIQYT